MADPLHAWWAQQLVLCGWAFDPEPASLDPTLAAERLAQLGVAERGELGWRLLEAFPGGTERADPQVRLTALELIALAQSAGWLTADRAEAWLAELEEVTRSFAAPVVAVLGNHDHWSGALAVRKTLERAGAEVLVWQYAIDFAVDR